MRGEHEDRVTNTNEVGGSSPHARGTHSAIISPPLIARIIPACAGNTVDNETVRQTDRDHPRMRGEHPYRIIPIPETMGSSPHARGTPLIFMLIRISTGIIPACAGNTRRTGPPAIITGDHPRMRGEHNDGRLTAFYGRGSSPHARGTLMSQSFPHSL